MQCPKCRAPMHTYTRSGVQIEQCSGCRGIFLDYGELEHITQLEAQWSPQAAAPQAPPPPPPPAQPYQQGPAWGAPQHGHGGHYHHRRKGGLSGLFFSS
ncbi:zf-TFIIB domain-containing protein [Streptomyces sp. DSM 44917]|uniref:Zf-TFIIB domain-containing protein n=1 Tax=Streptomyces boetiae TaxID=3075541 RepID=A0ABU2L7C1_9ACTN|nr:zf-TFIIB domain-containing protein [Streptomyces sp. DSM 44917]MDT0307103.1 zf-TFIIB domain-containing protein [Streptomyces sp. DSM 44917]